MTDLHAFDAALALSAAGPLTWSGQTHPAYSNFNGQFGGITAATLLRAVLKSAAGDSVPVSVTVNYCAAMAQGPFEISVREIRRGRTLQHWSADLVQGGKVCATALVALAQRKASWSHAPLSPPFASPPRQIAPLNNGDWKGWTQQYDMRIVQGSIEGLHGQPPFDAPQSARSLLWMRHSTPRLLDFEGLMCMSDAFFVRMIQVRNAFPPMGTVSISTYFHCDGAMLAAQGSDYLLCHADARVFRDTFHDQSAELWSRDGVLLANTHQIVWYAE
jgi:acyl-CoA thioesterase